MCNEVVFPYLCCSGLESDGERIYRPCPYCIPRALFLQPRFALLTWLCLRVTVLDERREGRCKSVKNEWFLSFFSFSFLFSFCNLFFFCRRARVRQTTLPVVKWFLFFLICFFVHLRQGHVQRCCPRRAVDRQVHDQCVYVYVCICISIHDVCVYVNVYVYVNVNVYANVYVVDW